MAAGHVAQARKQPHPIGKGGRGVLVELLDGRRRQARATPESPGERGKDPGEGVEQRGLARAARSHDGYPLRPAKLEVEVADERATSATDGEGFRPKHALARNGRLRKPPGRWFRGQHRPAVLRSSGEKAPARRDPLSTTAPPLRITHSPPRRRANRRSWVMVSSAPPSSGTRLRRAVTVSTRSASSPLVGSSAMTSGAPPALAAANAMRCAMPPERLPGSWRIAPSTSSSTRSARVAARASGTERPATRRWVSSTCDPDRMIGFSARHGSCGRRVTVLPHRAARPARGIPSTRLPPRRMLPVAARPGGNAPMTACASRLLPAPVSPITVRQPPGSSASDTGPTIVAPGDPTVTASSSSPGITRASARSFRPAGAGR